LSVGGKSEEVAENALEFTLLFEPGFYHWFALQQAEMYKGKGH
jgi:hypothetical protein